MTTLRRSLPLILATALATTAVAQESSPPISISGTYPHLASFSGNGECGIGAVVPWAGRLWWITYPPHMRKGSTDKLYSIDPSMNLTIHPESVGGTHANRMIHRESEQLIIGPYFIAKSGEVRAADVKNALIGRMTATARHLTDPANKVYFYDMEGPVYEVDVKSLGVTKLFEKASPGWHGKGAYTGQGRFITSNNGESSSMHDLDKSKVTADLTAKSPEDAGSLAEWDGKEWRIVERRQFTDITGPGGIEGAPDDKAPVWAMGWDRRSVILKLLDGGKWTTFRLPKASHTFDPKHGWYTEWPRIREAAKDQWLMVMHGMMFDFPQSFAAANTSAIRPRASHLRYIPDFCRWDDKLVLAADDTSIMQNALAGQSQSNLWFGTIEDVKQWGPAAGWGGVWLGDGIKAGVVSDPFHFAGYGQRTLHLAHNAEVPVTFTIEVDRQGRGDWQPLEKITVDGSGYLAHVFPADAAGEWVRFTADKDCTASAYFHYQPAHPHSGDQRGVFAALADVKSGGRSWTGGYVRPAKHNRNLQFIARQVDANGAAGSEQYYEVDEKMTFQKPADAVALVAEATKILAPRNEEIQIDAASVLVTDHEGKRYRLPKGPAEFDRPFATGAARMIREVVSERALANIHGTFYEIPRAEGAGKEKLEFRRTKPVSSHTKQITDFCTWRGLLVLAGCRRDAPRGKNYFAAGAESNPPGLWFGTIDDLWKLGKPVGEGGPWKDTAVKAGQPSDPYLMTNFDAKQLTLSHASPNAVKIRVEIDYSNRDFWKAYRTFEVEPGKSTTFEFPSGYSAHWVRFVADQDCMATAMLRYR